MGFSQNKRVLGRLLHSPVRGWPCDVTAANTGPFKMNGLCVVALCHYRLVQLIKITFDDFLPV